METSVAFSWKGSSKEDSLCVNTAARQGRSKAAAKPRAKTKQGLLAGHVVLTVTHSGQMLRVGGDGCVLCCSDSVHLGLWK